jgi:transcriptional regulator with XRE-family HTH domain
MTRTELAERRIEKGLTQAAVAEAIGCSVVQIQRYEAGTSTPRPGKRRPYAKVLDWTTAQLAQVLTGEVIDLPPNGHDVPTWLSRLARDEQAAARIWAFEPVVVHGLLQTAAYAYAVESIGPGTPTSEAIARKVAMRQARQAVLDREPDPLVLHFVLDESVLHRVAGGPEVMAGQLDHLLDLAVHANVTVQVLPLTAGVFSAAFGAFSLFTTPGHAEPYMAVVEDRAGPHYLDRQPEITTHISLFDFLREAALSPDESAERIAAARKEYQ